MFIDVQRCVILSNKLAAHSLFSFTHNLKQHTLTEAFGVYHDCSIRYFIIYCVLCIQM